MEQYILLANKVIDLFGVFFKPDAVRRRRRIKAIFYADEIVSLWLALTREKNAKKRHYLRAKIGRIVSAYSKVRKSIR